MTIDFKDWHTIIKKKKNHKKLFIHKRAGYLLDDEFDVIIYFWKAKVDHLSP
jgi:hypothetical protein